MILDPSMLEMLSELRIPGEPDPVEEIVTVFRDDARKVLTRLRSATEREDVEGVRQAAHRLKGSAANLGATALVELLRRVEQGASAGQLNASMREDVQAAAPLFEQTLLAIDAHVQAS